jgi:hypothetical protein
METYISLDKDTVKRVTTSEEVIDLKKLRGELVSIDKELASLEKEPDEVLMPNQNKTFRIEDLNVRKGEIQKFLTKI